MAPYGTDSANEAAIIGGGIAGATLLDRLASEGVKALLVEQGDLASGTTGRSIGMLDRLKPTAFEVELSRAANQFYRELVEQFRLSFVTCGYIHLAHSSKAAQEIRRTVRLARGHGEDVALLTPDEIDELLPGVRRESYRVAGYSPLDGYLDGHELVTALIRRATARGAQVQTKTSVLGLKLSPDGSRVNGIRTSRGDFEAPHVVVAAGPWTNELLGHINLELPLRGVPGQILTVRHSLGRLLPMVYDYDTRLYFRGEGTKHGLFGELDKGFRSNEVARPADLGERPSSAFVERVSAHWRHAYPSLAEGRIVGGWVGLRTVTPDALPLVGTTPVEGLWISTGYSGHGIQLAPATARMLVDRLHDRGTIPPEISTERLRQTG